MKLSTEEINIVRQWFNAVQDLNPKYLQKADHELYLKVLEAYKQPLNQGNANVCACDAPEVTAAVSYTAICKKCDLPARPAQR